VPQLWQIAPGQQLASWGWNDEFVLYNDLSGDTHLLDADSLELLVQLQRAPASIATLVTQLSDGVAPDDAAALPDTLATLLAQLQKLYLVELAATPC
jgi:PqqD family protein of HPr-rel-A system